MPDDRLEKARFVRVSKTGDLVFSLGGREMAVSVDDTLERAILEAKQVRSEMRQAPQPHQQSTLPISQIQSLIRAGADPARVAEKYHLSEMLVRRFSMAVETEKQYAIEQFLAVAAPKDSRVRTISELVERSRLLMRHELQSGNCTLEVEGEDENRDFTLHGDINNLVQVLNNLLSNAVYAQKQSGGGVITIGVKQDGDDLKIYVKDTGPGVKPQVKKRLFKEMITSKGTMGTGLGLYISNTVVRGKFGGSMWVEDNPGGGAIFGMSIPLCAVSVAQSNDKGGSRQ